MFSMIISVASAKGGVGKTTVIANLGLTLTKVGINTLLLDTDLASGNLALHMGLKKPHPSLHELLSGDAQPTEDVIRTAIFKGPAGVFLLPSGSSLRGFLGCKLEFLPGVISEVSKYYDAVLVDTSPGISKNSIAPLEVSDRVILVTTPDPVAVSTTSSTRDIASLMGKEVLGVIVNRQKKGGFFSRATKQMEIGEIKAELRAEILGVIPEDDSVGKATAAGIPVVLQKPRASASKAFKNLSPKLEREIGRRK